MLLLTVISLAAATNALYLYKARRKPAHIAPSCVRLRDEDSEF